MSREHLTDVPGYGLLSCSSLPQDTQIYQCVCVCVFACLSLEDLASNRIRTSHWYGLSIAVSIETRNRSIEA